MSNGAVFALLVNDGKADRMINASEMLRARIQMIRASKEAAGEQETDPLLAEIEQSHVIPFNAHYRPVVACNYEYIKSRPSAGNPTLGQSVIFSIPQAGDFITDMVLHTTLSPTYSSSQTAPTQSANNAAAAINSTLGTPQPYPANGNDWNNASGSNTVAGSFYSLVDPFGNAVADGGTYRNLVRYCAYPGERLCTSVSFDVNNNPLDSYTQEAVVMKRNFGLAKSKQAAYKRLVGQETPLQGYGGPSIARVADNDQSTSSAIDHLTGANDTAANAAAIKTPAAFMLANFPENQTGSTPHTSPSLTVVGSTTATHANAPLYFDVVRESKFALNGAQTPKYWQPSLELWSKLRFWFNDDARLAIPSVCIPFGQRFITVQLAASTDLVYEAPGLYVKQVVETDRAFADPLTAPNTRVVRFRPYFVAGTVTAPTVTAMELYINNLYVNAEIHDIYIQRISFMLIRVHRTQIVRSNTDSQDEKLLQQFKWPVELIMFGLRPAWNTSSANPNVCRDWCRYGKVVDLVVDRADQAEVAHNALFDQANQAVVGTNGQLIPGVTSSVGQVCPDRYEYTLPIISSVSLSAHGIKFFDAMPASFFNSYVPERYGHAAMVAPDERDCMVINFSLFPGSYQPSGHLNVSRAREFYLSWQTNYISANTPADLVAVAQALNFLLISDGTASLRYST